MDTLIDNHLIKLNPGSIQTFERMAVAPLFAPSGGPMYLTLPEAQAQHVLTVTEISAGGSVPQLRAENRADLPVLLLDGEELAGAKQNRVVNTTMLIPASSATTIPVSCTEQGRWDYVSPEFADSGVIMTHRLRASKSSDVSHSLATRGDYMGDQGMVWDKIDDLHRRSGTHSQTRAMRDAYESRKTAIEDYVNAFAPQAGQTGLLVFIDGRIVGLDNLSWDLAYAQLCEKLLRSYAIEATIGKPVKNGAASEEATARFIEKARHAAERKYPSVGLGEDYRFGGQGLVGTALVHGEHVIHLAFFPIENGGTDESRMMPPRWRRGQGPVVE